MFFLSTPFTPKQTPHQSGPKINHPQGNIPKPIIAPLQPSLLFSFELETTCLHLLPWDVSVNLRGFSLKKNEPWTVLLLCCQAVSKSRLFWSLLCRHCINWYNPTQKSIKCQLELPCYTILNQTKLCNLIIFKPYYAFLLWLFYFTFFYTHSCTGCIPLRDMKYR